MTKQELLNEVDAYKKRIIENSGLACSAVQLEGVSEMACKKLMEMVTAGQIEITEELLKTFYRLNQEHQDETCQEAVSGDYRSINIQPEWAKHTPPAPEDLDHYMKHFIGQMQISRQMFHPIEFAAICHKRVLEIYPFKEGNEAVAMLVLNLILLGNGYEGIVSFNDNKSIYLDKLIKAQHPSQPDIDGYITFVAGCVLQAEKKKCHDLGA